MLLKMLLIFIHTLGDYGLKHSCLCVKAIRECMLAWPNFYGLNDLCRNPTLGVIINHPNGSDVYGGVKIDYRTDVSARIVVM